MSPGFPHITLMEVLRGNKLIYKKLRFSSDIKNFVHFYFFHIITALGCIILFIGISVDGGDIEEVIC